MNNIVKYIIKTSIRMVLLLFGVSVVCFMLVTSAPIDPVEAYVGSESNVSAEHKAQVAEYWGLNKPPVERYFTWLGNVLKGDMGESISFRKPVATILRERVLTSLALMITAWVFSGIIGFVLGVASGVYSGTWADRIIKTFCFTMSSTPTFWLGLILLMIFAVVLNWFPVGFAVPVGKAAADVTLGDRIHHLILPAFALSIMGVSNIALHTRQKMVDVFRSEYVLFGKARGETTWQTVKRHGLRNISIPAITLQFASFSELFGGSVLAEQVFSYPGLGNAATTAGLRGDVPLLLGVALVTVIFVFVGNMISNILYGVLNPEIREGYRA